MEHIVESASWSFDNHMLVLGRLSTGDMLTQIPLFNIPLWVQLHDVPTGFVTPMVGKHMENFIREFLEYDSKNNTGGSRPFMRIKVLVGLRNPLKTGKKLIKPKGEWQMIESNCERLGNFCFACDVIGHREKFYPRIQNSLQRSQNQNHF